jgi:ketosteroid isomerase-like protein
MSTTAETEATLQKHMAAFGSANVDAILADYDDNAVFISPEGIFRGKDQLRTMFEQLTRAFPSGSPVELHNATVDGNMAYIVWSGESRYLKVHFATDTLIVRNGLIVQQTFAAQMDEK